jgi:hypothetical protein
MASSVHLRRDWKETMPMHLPTMAASRTDRQRDQDTPKQLHLFGEPRRWPARPGMLGVAALSLAGAFALVYAVKTFVQRSRPIRGDVLDDERFDRHSPAHAGYDR